MTIDQTKAHPTITSIESIPAELRGKATVSVQTAARVLGIGRDAAYSAVRSGQIVSLRFASRIVIPVQPLLRQLGIEPAAGGEPVGADK